MPIDYSKWDNLEVSSSEDEDDSPSPRVTRLDAPSKVTFGGKQGSISAVPQGHAKAKQPKSQLTSQPLEASKPTKPPPKSTSTSAIGDTSAPPSWTEHGGLLASDGGNVELKIKRKLYWAQDRYSVTLRLELRKGEKVGSVIVEGILPYSDRWSAVGSTKPRLVCRSSSSMDNVTLLEGELPHPVHLAEEDSDDGLIDWTVTAVAADAHRFLVITLHKAVPMQGLSVWWRRPLMEFPEADLDAVRGSGNSSGGSNASGTLSGGGASKDFLEAWEEAHKIFREGKQKRAEGKPAI